MILKNADDRSADLAVLRRLLEEAASPRQRAFVQHEIDNLIAGHKGERDVASYLNHHYRDWPWLPLTLLAVGASASSGTSRAPTAGQHPPVVPFSRTVASITDRDTVRCSDAYLASIR